MEVNDILEFNGPNFLPFVDAAVVVFDGETFPFSRSVVVFAPVGRSLDAFSQVVDVSLSTFGEVTPACDGYNVGGSFGSEVDLSGGREYTLHSEGSQPGPSVRALGFKAFCF